MLDDMLKFMSQSGIPLKLLTVLLFLGLEHLMDVVFVCPCDPEWNFSVSTQFFVLPAIVIFLLMLVMQFSPKQTGCLSADTSANYSAVSPIVQETAQPDNTDEESCCVQVVKGVWNFAMAAAAAFLWVMMMFFEGQFYVCLKTDWSGRFVKVNDTYVHMWCKPDQSANSTDKMKLSIGYYVDSQWMGIYVLRGILGLVAFYAIGSLVWMRCKKKVNEWSRRPTAAGYIQL